MNKSSKYYFFSKRGEKDECTRIRIKKNKKYQKQKLRIKIKIKNIMFCLIYNYHVLFKLQ